MLNHLKRLFHRHLWQRLPRSWRREALFHASVLAAPRPSAHAKPSAPVLVAGVLRTASGLGESARLCHDALKLSGLPVYGIDLTVGMMQQPDYPDFPFADGRALEGPGTLVLHVNSPLVPLALSQLGRRVVRGKYVIGYWAWELPRVPADWRHGIRFVHEIWVPSTFTAEAVRPVAAGRPVRVVPHPVTLRGAAGLPRGPRPERPFSVLVMFDMASSFARKNPLASVAAFRRAFGDDPSTRLIVKTTNGQVFPSGMSALGEAIGTAKNIVVIDKPMSTGEIEALYRESDVLMSLHRSEGFGLTLAEAMLRGLPVVATAWSGSADFLSGENGLPIPYRLVPAEDPQGTYHHPDMMWADVDVDAAAEALRRLRREPALSRVLGEAGAAYAARVWNARGYAESVRQHLRL